MARTCGPAAVGAALLAVLVAACAGPAPSPAPTASPSPAPTGDVVAVGGLVFTDLHIGVEGCAALTPPQELSGVVITFADDAGEEVGEATTGPLSQQQLADGCRWYASYAVDLPRRDSYEVDFDPPEPVTQPGGGYFDGANQLEPQTILFDDLAAQDFEWHFEAPPGFVVP